MKLNVVDLSKTRIGERELPQQFNEAVRPDLIKRAVHTLQINRRQRYGASPDAGKRASAGISKRRRDYKTCYGHGISRVPRKVLSGKGMRMYWVGAFAPGMVGGRRAHPPKPTKIWLRKINKKEQRKAIRSAIAATVDKEYLSKRLAPEGFPFIISSNIEEITQTKQVKEILIKIGLEQELERSSVRKVRSGKGKLRGRKYKTKKGPLIVVSKDCNLLKSGKNIPGIDITLVDMLNAELLAPGAQPGRITIWTESSIERLNKEKLFM